VNVVDLFRLQTPEEHPHGLSDRDFDSLFTADTPVIFNFHAYPALIHKLTYKRAGNANFHVHGYKERGNINTPLSLAIKNQIDRYDLVIDVIDRVPSMRARGAHLKDRMKNAIIDALAYADTNGIDRPEITGWTWPQTS
jgi:xylulose-5-phosphate/fructose-6-phosphate phosphoketolase